MNLIGASIKCSACPVATGKMCDGLTEPLPLQNENPRRLAGSCRAPDGVRGCSRDRTHRVRGHTQPSLRPSSAWMVASIRSSLKHAAGLQEVTVAIELLESAMSRLWHTVGMPAALPARGHEVLVRGVAAGVDLCSGYRPGQPSYRGKREVGVGGRIRKRTSTRRPFGLDTHGNTDRSRAVARRVSEHDRCPKTGDRALGNEFVEALQNAFRARARLMTRRCSRARSRQAGILVASEDIHPALWPATSQERMPNRCHRPSAWGMKVTARCSMPTFQVAYFDLHPVGTLHQVENWVPISHWLAVTLR